MVFMKVGYSITHYSSSARYLCLWDLIETIETIELPRSGPIRAWHVMA